MANNDDKMQAALADAITAAGNAKKFAKAIGVTAQAVSQWDIVPVGRVLAVEKATGVSRYRLRPDIYEGEPTPRGAEAQAAA